MKTNLRYYPHRTDAHRHEKFKMLRAILGSGAEGWAAEGRFWALNNLIAEADECKLDLSKIRSRAVVAEELSMTLPEFEKFVSVLKSPDVELLTEIAENIYTTRKVEEVYLATSQEREKARERKSTKPKNGSSAGNPESSGELLESSGEPTKKLNQTKLNQTKPKEEVPPNPPGGCPPPPPLPEADDQDEPDAPTPDFSERDSVRNGVRLLFAKYAEKTNPHQGAEVKQVAAFVLNPREGLTREQSWQCVVEAFIALAQSNRRDTSYLLGIIKQKLIEKQAEKLKNEQKTKKTQAQADRKAASLAAAEEGRVTREYTLSEARKFFDQHPEMFNSREKSEFLSAVAEGAAFLAATIVAGKREILHTKTCAV